MKHGIYTARFTLSVSVAFIYVFPADVDRWRLSFTRKCCMPASF